ncbi:MAG: hypothetical protein EHM59_03130 [Betaproteobacteria bacterium]|nr:MAG: hypothetical protein EHM59_03130 [Betaproteobacteria bacterium]
MGVVRGVVTPAIRTLRAAGVTFAEHLYDYEERGGTRVGARELGIDLERIYINGGKRGLLVAIDPRALPLLLQTTVVDVALPRS